MPKTFDDAINQEAQRVANLVISKQKDYGPKNIMESPAGPENGVIVRLFDKAARIENLTEKAILELQNASAKELKLLLKDMAQNEPLEDTWMDIAGYALIMLMVRNNTFELPLADDE